MLSENYGRRNLYTDATEVTSENVIDILRTANIEHNVNASRCEFLLNYEAGLQPLKREKITRREIDCHCVDNVANQITEFKLSFVWNNAITLTQRGEVDSGSAKESKAISLLNECYEAEGIRQKTQTLARFIEICGVGYELVDINADWEDGESYFNIEPLDPRYTFVVKSTRVGHKPILGVTFRKDTLGNTYYTCFSKDSRYEVLNLVKIIEPNGDEKNVDEWKHMQGSGAVNPIGAIPIIEWIRATDRMGCFERQISEMDNLNLLLSDFSNDVEQNTNCIWHMNDCQLPVDETTGQVIKPESGEWLQTQTTRDGKSPFVKPLDVSYDYNGMLNNIITRRQLILVKCDVPTRNDDSGGSTGTAMDSATGWSSAEANACKEEAIISACKMEEIKVVLKAIKNSPKVESDNPMMDLRAIDIVPSIKRQKTYEMTTKINALATAIDHGVDWKSMIRAINFFSDPQQVIDDSEETIKRYLDKQFGSEDKDEEETLLATETANPPKFANSSDDPQNQIDNSPNLDGISTGGTIPKGDEE